MVSLFYSIVYLLLCSMQTSTAFLSNHQGNRQNLSHLFSSGERTPAPRTDPEKLLPTIEVVASMPDSLPMDLKNEYYLLRHGQSTANVASIISSSRDLAYSTKHGLTDEGYDQGFASAQPLVDTLQKSQYTKVVFVSSPFARAYQTAQACLDGIAKISDVGSLDIDTTIRVNEALMERYFGKLDDAAIETYGYVWPLDMEDVLNTDNGVESVAAVATRLRRLILLDLETKMTHTNVVLVSHADVLQICQLYGAGAENVGSFSSYRFKNGEVRQMARTPDSLPAPIPLEVDAGLAPLSKR